MTFRVEITSEAEKDLLRIGDWISEKSPESARRWTFSAWNAIRSLESGALGCSLAPENEHVSEEVRNIFFRTRRGRTYRALFFYCRRSRDRYAYTRTRTRHTQPRRVERT